MKFVIFCEGENTEPAYLRALREVFSNSIIIEIKGAAGVPETQTTLAIRKLKELGLHKSARKSLDLYEKKDQVWVMFDRDDHPKYLEASNICADHGIGVARSNPCFELWLILHFVDFNRPDGRHAVQRHLATLIPDYDPNGSKLCDCGKFIGNLALAEKRADTLVKRRYEEGDLLAEPSTTVHHLTKAIKEASENV